MRYDAAIVGAGAAGSMAAYLLSKKGYRVIVREKTVPWERRYAGGW